MKDNRRRPPKKEEEGPPRNLGRELDDLISLISKKLANFEIHVRTLPTIDSDGKSSCPNAAQLHAQADAEIDKMHGHLHQLESYVSPVEKELDRCRTNLQKLRSTTPELKTQTARDEFLAAEAKQAQEYGTVAEQRRKLMALISKIQNAIKKVNEIIRPPKKGGEKERPEPTPPKQDPEKKPPPDAGPPASPPPIIQPIYVSEKGSESEPPPWADSGKG